MENIERDRLYIVNSGKGGCFFAYDSVTGEEELVNSDEGAWWLITERSTSFNLDTRNYKGDVCTLPKSMGTMIYVNDRYGLYGYLTSKKNRRTKQMTLTINFFPAECFDKFKTKMLNTSGQWIEVPDDSLKPHGNINKKHIGFTDEKGKAVETKNVYSYLQRRLDRTKREEVQQLPDINELISEEGQHQSEEKQTEKEVQHQLGEKQEDKEGQQLPNISELPENRENGKINGNRFFLINIGLSGENKYCVYDREKGTYACLDLNIKEHRDAIEEDICFDFQANRYNKDICSIDESIGTLAFTIKEYGLYGIVKKAPKTNKKALITLGFYTEEWFEANKDKVANYNNPESLIEVSNDLDWDRHSGLFYKGLEYYYFENDGIGIRILEKEKFLDERRHITNTKRREAEARELENNILGEKENSQAEEKQQSEHKSDGDIDILKTLVLREQQLFEERQRLEKLKEQLEKKSDYLIEKQIQLENREATVKLREDKLIPLYNIAICTAKDRNTQLEVAKSYSTKEKEYTREDYLYEYKLKTAMPYETVMIPMSYYKKIRAGSFQAFNVNRDATQYDILGAIRFEDSKSKNLVAMINYDESQEFIRIVVIKEYNRIGFSDHDIAMFERNYRIWFKEVMGSVRPHNIK